MSGRERPIVEGTGLARLSGMDAARHDRDPSLESTHEVPEWLARCVGWTEENGLATVWIAVVVALAGMGRGVTPAFGGDFGPLLIHALAGLAMWLGYTLLVWMLARRVLGRKRPFLALLRVLGLPALVLLGLWGNGLPLIESSPAISIALHAIAFLLSVALVRTALSVPIPHALGLSVAAVATGVLLAGVLGVPLAAASGSRFAGEPPSSAIAAVAAVATIAASHERQPLCTSS